MPAPRLGLVNDTDFVLKAGKLSSIIIRHRILNVAREKEIKCSGSSRQSTTHSARHTGRHSVKLSSSPCLLLVGRRTSYELRVCARVCVYIDVKEK